MRNFERLANTVNLMAPLHGKEFTKKEFTAVMNRKGGCSLDFLRRHRFVKVVRKESFEVELKEPTVSYSVEINGVTVAKDVSEWRATCLRRDLMRLNTDAKAEVVEHTSTTCTAYRFFYVYDEKAFLAFAKKSIRDSKSGLQKSIAKTEQKLNGLKSALRLLEAF